MLKVYGRFNSTMVRLKVRYPLRYISLEGFNSTMVRLKEEEAIPSHEAFPSFNSTMVRLKELMHPDSFNSLIVSIPLWYD